FYIPKRLIIIIFCVTGIIISYADRSNMAIAIVYMTLDFGYTSTVQGVILSSFFFGYLTTQVLGGALADKYGGKWVLGVSAVLWTLFTFLTPISAKMGLEYLLLCRILLGVGEGVCFPSVNSLIAAWFPIEESSKAVSAIVSSAYIGIVIALPIATWLGSGPFGISQKELDIILKNKASENLSYRIETGEIINESTTNENDNVTLDASLNNFVNEENNEFGSEVDALLPKKLILSNSKNVPWKFILSRREVWAILIAQFCNSFVLPYAAQGATGIIAGIICDYAINKLNIRIKTVRRGAQLIGAVGTSTFLLCTAYLAQTPLQGIILISIGTALNSFFSCSVHVSQLDIAPRYAGAIYGLGNTCAGIPAVLGVAFTGWILDITNRNWNIIWILVTIFYATGSIFFVKWVGHKVITG
ncbi:3702_t:CDS:2, partial [Cetraspora pellucida]